jgi:hypothetical protein
MGIFRKQSKVSAAVAASKARILEKRRKLAQEVFDFEKEAQPKLKAISARVADTFRREEQDLIREKNAMRLIGRIKTNLKELEKLTEKIVEEEKISIEGTIRSRRRAMRRMQLLQDQILAQDRKARQLIENIKVELSYLERLAGTMTVQAELKQKELRSVMVFTEEARGVLDRAEEALKKVG